MKRFDFGQQAEAIVAGMSKEEFLAALEERCPELLHGQGPKPPDAMVPGPRYDTGPSLQAVWEKHRQKVKGKKEPRKSPPAPQRAIAAKAAPKTSVKHAATKAAGAKKR